MNYDVVVGVGCSYMNADRILGKTLKVATEYRPGNILSNKLKCDYVNLARTGSSNGGMFRRIYDWVESNVKYKNPLFVIGLSESTRYPFYSEHKGEFYDLQPGAVASYTDEALEGINTKLTNSKDSVQNLRQWLEYYVQWVYNDEVEDKKLQRKIVFLHHYLKGNNCDYRIHNSLQDSLDGIKSEINYISFQDDRYNGDDTWVEYLRWQMREVDNESVEEPDNTKYRSPISPYGKRFCDGHPSPNANKELAERIYEDLR